MYEKIGFSHSTTIAALKNRRFGNLCVPENVQYNFQEQHRQRMMALSAHQLWFFSLLSELRDRVYEKVLFSRARSGSTGPRRRGTLFLPNTVDNEIKRIFQKAI